ncbi:MAG: alpha/beta fold hydrolase BchO [Pseudomonadota bacterium]
MTDWAASAALSGARPGLDWAADGADWPNRSASRFVQAGGLSWHVQILGDGPPLLLLHGTGASTHSWRALAPLLAERFTVVAPDLPGHGFTQRPPHRGLTLPGVAAAVDALMGALRMAPDAIVGHSAGAAIAARMALDAPSRYRRLVSLNGAFLPFDGPAAVLFPAMAKALFLNPFAPRLISHMATRPGAVERLIASTGSSIDEEGLELYRRLMSRSEHIAGVTAMMAKWDLVPLRRELGGLGERLALVVARGDETVPPHVGYEIKALAPEATLIQLDRLGHLAHEEAPERLAAVIDEAI